MDETTLTILADAGYDIYSWVFDIDPSRDCDKPLFRSIGERCFTIQTTYLQIPPRLGFFSPGPSRLQGMEACFVAKLASFYLIFYPFLGMMGLLGLLPYSFMRKAALLPPAMTVIAWILMCIVSGQGRQFVTVLPLTS
ncbi:hypothetical protein CCHR01_14247 [Colletotrichum chrysophilum]|uniref:Uncharacterized protein n=1 Tax=Colletotrichum chrysophilum TaxID=1836956 RepID=A0AAD9A7Y8_9PEZI|nr:hypothetical protein CCHR01_14247 [Colletotrichum chrysophilum]